MAKILVVDDNVQLNSMLKDVLESWGHTVLVAEEGRLCLDCAHKEHPDIILLDVMLPGLSGYDVCSELRKDPVTENTIIIMITALADVDNRIHGYKLGADNFLVKPINYDELQAIINKYIDTKNHMDTMEERKGVVSTLLQFICLANNHTYDQAEIEKEVISCRKILDILNWDKAKSQQAIIATLLRGLVSFKNIFRLQQDQTEQLLSSLHLSTWLIPVLHYLDVADLPEGPELRQKIQTLGLEDVADFVILIDRVFALMLEQPDKELIIAILKRETLTKKYNSQILAALEQNFSDDKILEMMQDI